MNVKRKTKNKQVKENFMSKLKVVMLVMSVITIVSGVVVAAIIAKRKKAAVETS